MSDAGFGQVGESTPDSEVEEEGLVYAGFWLRVVAALIDGLILVVPALVAEFLLFPEMFFSEQPLQPSLEFFLFEIVYLLIVIAYMAGFESSAYQATVGKHIIGIQVTDLEGKRVSFAAAFKRGWFYWLPALVGLVDILLGIVVLQLIIGLAAFVSCIMVAFTERKQALHDMMANCLVIRRPD